MEDLRSYRAKIDEIDRQLVSLFEERMEIVLKIADYKKKNNIPILDEGREKEVESLSGLIGGDGYRIQKYLEKNNTLTGSVTVKAMAMAGLEHHRELAKLAYEETKRGVYEDKVIKNFI